MRDYLLSIAIVLVITALCAVAFHVGKHESYQDNLTQQLIQNWADHERRILRLEIALEDSRPGP